MAPIATPFGADPMEDIDRIDLRPRDETLIQVVTEIDVPETRTLGEEEAAALSMLTPPMSVIEIEPEVARFVRTTFEGPGESADKTHVKVER